MANSGKPKPGTTGAAEWTLNSYGFRLESIRGDAGRLYSVYNMAGRSTGDQGYKVSDNMLAKELKAWVQGFVVAREGRASVYV